MNIEMKNPPNGDLQPDPSPDKKAGEEIDDAEKEQNGEEVDVDFSDESMLFYPGKRLVLIHTSKWRVRWDRSV